MPLQGESATEIKDRASSRLCWVLHKNMSNAAPPPFLEVYPRWCENLNRSGIKWVIFPLKAGEGAKTRVGGFLTFLV